MQAYSMETYRLEFVNDTILGPSLSSVALRSRYNSLFYYYESERAYTKNLQLLLEEFPNSTEDIMSAIQPRLFM